MCFVHSNILPIRHLSRDMTKPTIECAPSQDSDQPEHPPSLIRVFAVCMKKAWALIYPVNAQRRLRSDWADAQTDLSLRWAHSHTVGFVVSWLISLTKTIGRKIKSGETFGQNCHYQLLRGKSFRNYFSVIVVYESFILF